MGLIAIDLGSTNIKAAIYDDALRLLACASRPVCYIRENGQTEFDAVACCQAVETLVAALVIEQAVAPGTVRRIVLTGQAESLVVLDRNSQPLMNAISWMDERSAAECRHLAACFSPEELYQRTGQLAMLPTWPATKILWLQNHRPDIYGRVAHYVLLKDYLVFHLTGRLLADCSIATFTCYFDIINKRYWPEMLQACGIRADQLPPLAEPCSDAGALRPAVACAMGLTAATSVNIGTLDHFAGMIGTGNVRPGMVSLSTGTVMALAALAPRCRDDQARVALHYGYLRDTHVFLSVAESGGICLEWFRDHFAKELSYADLDILIQTRNRSSDLLFLPYLVGTNAPEFAADACGAFLGLRARHDAVDLAQAVMEGVACLLARNIDALRAAGVQAERIIATGGGARSAVWCQMQADMTGVPVAIPEDQEAACRGAAMIGAVAAGLYGGLAEAARQTVRIIRQYEPRPDPGIARKRQQFDRFYEAMLEITRL